MGVLASDPVVETSSSDLIGSYIGHSRENVEKTMKKARGGVCFIDEAYHLGVGPFGSEALTQLLTMLTLPEYMDGKTIVVLAGYDKEIHKMLESNLGLKSRFASYLRFEDWTPEKCLSFVCKLGAKEIPLAFILDDQGKDILRGSFEEIRSRPGWANARDVIQLYKRIVTARDVRMARGTSSTTDPSLIATEDIEKAVSEMLRARPAATFDREDDMSARVDMPVQMNEGHEDSARTVSKEKESMPEEGKTSSAKPTLAEAEFVVSDNDEEKEQTTDREELYASLLNEVTELQKEYVDIPGDGHAKGCKDERERLAKEKELYEKMLEEKKLTLKRARAASKEREKQRLLEIARKKEAELQRKRKQELRRQRIRRELMAIGKCVQGFKWRKTGSGYRCEGGSHFASFKDIAVKTSLSEDEVLDAFKE